MATNPELSRNSSQTGDQSANDYANVWDYFGDIGLNDQELAEVTGAGPGDQPVTPEVTQSTTAAPVEYRSERLQPVSGQSEASVDATGTVVKIDHSTRPDATVAMPKPLDTKSEATTEPTTVATESVPTATQESVVAEQPVESITGSTEQSTVTTEVIEPRASTEQSVERTDEVLPEVDAEETEQESGLTTDEHEAEGLPYAKEELEQYRLPDNAEEAKAQGLLESFEENGLGHSQVDEVVRFALKNPGGVRVTLNDDQKNAFEGWMKDHSDWMDGDDARRVWQAVAPDSEKWRDPANPDDDVSKSIEGGFANPTNLADGKALLRSQQSADGKVVEKQGKAMPASDRFVNKLQQITPGVKRAKEPSKLVRTMAPVMTGLILATTLGSNAGAVVANAKADAGGGKSQESMSQTQYTEDEARQLTMNPAQAASRFRKANSEHADRHYNADNLPAADYHMWGHDNGDGTYDCSFKKTASSFTGAIDTSSQESITKHVMESCESTPEQLAGMSVALLPQDVLEQNGYNGNVNDFADHLKEDDEARANVLNAFRETESKVSYQHATLEEGTIYKSLGISRTSGGEMVLLASGNRIVRSGGKDVLVAQVGDRRMVIDPDCDNLIEVQANEEGEVVQHSRTIYQGGGEETPPPGEETPPPGEETPPPGEETPPPGEETPPDDSKHTSEVFRRQQGSQDPVSTNDNQGNVNNPTGRTSQSQPGATVTDPSNTTKSGGNASGSGNGGNKSSGGSSATTVKTPGGSSVTGTGGTSNSDGTRTNADATVTRKDGSAETAKDAREKAVTAKGSEEVNSGTVDINSYE